MYRSLPHLGRAWLALPSTNCLRITAHVLLVHGRLTLWSHEIAIELLIRRQWLSWQLTVEVLSFDWLSYAVVCRMLVGELGWRQRRASMR